MSLLWPGFLYLLLLIPLAIGIYILILRRRRRFAVRYSSLSLVREAAAKQSWLRKHLPFILFLLALLSMASVGYQSGLSATRRSPEMLVLVLAFAGVMLLIADMDHPRAGFLVVSQEALADVRGTMDATQP